MKKRFFAMVLALILTVSIMPAALALEGDTARCADTLAALNLVQGTNGDYRLDEPTTRAHAAALLVRLAGAQSAAAADPWSAGFRDLPAWAADAIDYAAHQGWIKGKTMTLFRPNETVTANAWFTMLLRMLGYSDANGDFAVSDAAAFARRIGLVSRNYSGTMTRGDVFESMVDALVFRGKTSEKTVIQNLLERNLVPAYTARALGLLNEKLSARQMADRFSSAVFCIDVYRCQHDLDVLASDGSASGFFISQDGLAVTNYHAIDGVSFAAATLVTGEHYPIERVIYYDKDIDIAVIQVSKTSVKNHTTSAFAYLDVIGTSSIRTGDIVYAIGNPLGLGLAVSSGIISATERDASLFSLPSVMSTASISHGSSGGALLNEYGQVIAITAGAYTNGNNMYLAVPADPVLTADLTVKGWTLAEVARKEYPQNITNDGETVNKAVNP